MSCQVKRNKNTGEIERVLTNGKDSLLFESLQRLGLDKETAFDKWALVYTHSFKRWFGNWEAGEQPDTAIVDVNGEPSITVDPETGVPIYAKSLTDFKHATENFGGFLNEPTSKLVDHVISKYNLVEKNGSPRNIKYGAVNLADTINREYPNVYAEVARNYKGNFIFISPQEGVDQENIYHQTQTDAQRIIDEELNASMENFLQSIGVSVNLNATEILDKNGKKIDATAKADMYNRIVDVVLGKAGVDTLPEEAAHFFVEMLEAEGNPLFQSMYNNIESYQVYQDVINDDVYQEQYEGNEHKLKKEAVGKLIARHIVAQHHGTEADAKVARVQRWWEKVLNYLKGIFKPVATNPYARAAYIMLNEKATDYLKADVELEGEYFQSDTETAPVDPRKDTLDKLDEIQKSLHTQTVTLEESGNKAPWVVEEGSNTIDRYVGKPGTKFEGVVVRGRVSDDVKKHFHKMQIARKEETSAQKAARVSAENIRKESGTAGHKTLEDLIQYYANKQGTLASISAASPFANKSHFESLRKEVEALVKETNAVQKKIDPKGKVNWRTEQIIYNKEKDTAGSIDVLAVFSDNSAAIYDWKFVSPSIEKGFVSKVKGRWKIMEDPFSVKMDTYNIQMGAYKQMLLNDYGITEVRRSRIVPIHVRFKSVNGKMTNRITTIQMGSNASEFLEHIPVAEEMTDYDSINDIIVKMIAKKKKIESELRNKKRVGSKFEKLTREREMVEKQLRKLQLKQDIGYVLAEAGKDLKGIESKIAENNPLDAKGQPNPDYMTIEELNDLNGNLTFHLNLLKVSDYIEELKVEDPALHKEVVQIQATVGAQLNNVLSMVQNKQLERMVAAAEERNVKGLDSFNSGISKLTSQFVTLSKQTNPFLRTLHSIVDDLNLAKRKQVKQLAADIEDKERALLDWGAANGMKGIKVYDLLINNETGNFVAKFSPKYYEERTTAIKNGNSVWFKNNTYINEEGYKKNFKKYRDNRLKALKQKFKDNKKAIEREILVWDQQHDIKKHFKTASVNRGGSYFLKPNESWMSPEYSKLQSIPAAKEFYDFYQSKVYEYEDMFGIDLAPGFIANVHRSSMESLVTGGKIKDLAANSLEALQLREHDLSFGIRDENTGELVKRVPMLYVNPLKDSLGNIDPSLKSRDLGKGLLLLGSAALDYKLKTDVLPEVQALESLLQQNIVAEVETDPTGNVLTNLSGHAKKLFESTANADTFSGFVDQYFFRAGIKGKDFKIGKLSGHKTLGTLKQYHSTAALGLKVPVAIGAFTAGLFSLEAQASKGRYITRKNLRAAEKAFLTADPKLRAIAEFFDIYQHDIVDDRANRLSADYRTKHLTNDKWFKFLSDTDRALDAISAYAMSLNYGVDPATSKVKLLSKLPEGTKSINELIEFTEDPKWESAILNVSSSARDRYITKVEGLTPAGELSFRNKSRGIGDKIKGTMTDEDIALFNNTILMKYMMHYKSWLPGIAMEHFGSTRYDYILEGFDEGTWISTFKNMGMDMTAQEALDTEVHMMNKITAIGMDLLNAGMDIATFGYSNRFKIKEKKARLAFNQWVANNKDNPEFSEQLKSEASKEEMFKDFVEMKQGNIRATLTEARSVLLLMMLIMMLGGDWDDDGKKDIRQTWVGRKLYNVLNRSYREVAVFMDPREYMQSRSTGIPLLSLGGDVIKWANNSLDETFDLITGREDKDDGAEAFYYTMKMTPGLNALGKAFETHSQFKNSTY